MTLQRSYGQSCPVAHALDMVGDRWALLVIRELRLGPRRYADLQASLPGLGPSVLAQRLRELVDTGVLERGTVSVPTRAEVYRLTAWGVDLEPVFVALARWGVRSPVVPLRGDISDDAVMLGVRTFFPPTGDREWTATYRVELGREQYAIDVVGGTLHTLVRCTGVVPAGPPVATLHTTGDIVRSLLVGELSSAEAQDDGAVLVEGDRPAGRRLLRTIACRG